MTMIPGFITPPFAASILSAMLTLVPNPLVAQLGLAGSMGLGGYSYAIATSPAKGKRQKGLSTDQEIRRLKQELSDVQHRVRLLTIDKKKLTTDLASSQAARSGLVNKVRLLEATSTDGTASPLIDTCEYRKQLRSLNAAIEAKDSEIAELSAALDSANDGMADRVAAVKAETLLTGSTRFQMQAEIESLTEDKQKLSAAYRSLNTALENAGLQYDAELSELGGIKEAQDKQALETIQHWKTQAAKLDARIKELEIEAAKPGRFGGLGAADVMGNRLIDFLTDNGVVMSAVETDPNPDKGLLVVLKPACHTSSIEVKNLMPRCESSLGLHSLPSVSLGNGNYHFRLAVDPIKNAETVKLGSNLKRLEKAIDDANHLFIFGSSGSGKSVFLDNAIWLGRCLWPDAKLDLCDPKAPFTEWSSLEPTHAGSESTIDAVISMAKKMKERLADARKQHKETGVVPEYPRHIFAIDEATVAYSDAKLLDMDERKGEKLAVNFGVSVASVLRLGRALGFKGYLLSQTMLVSKLGLNNGDYGNATCIFLNGMIDRALKGDLRDLFEADDITAIEKELERRREQSQKYIGLVADANTGELFLFEMPRPGFYHDRFKAENGETVSASRGPVHTVTHSDVKTREALQDNGAKPVEETVKAEPITDNHAALTGALTSASQPRAKCPECSEASTKLNGQKTQKNGKRRFICENDNCKKKTFSALPE